MCAKKWHSFGAAVTFVIDRSDTRFRVELRHFAYDRAGRRPKVKVVVHTRIVNAREAYVRAALVAAICLFTVTLSAQQPSYVPAQLQVAAVPPLPVLAVGGGEVLLEV